MLFTDLRGSSRYYRDVGDAPAFGFVADHLEALAAAVAAEGGSVVKAMGDAIMAVFATPAPAVRAAVAAQRGELRRPPLALKAGVHAGPCIAVTQNGRLDYFGSTVNLAARLVALSSGDDVIVSADVARDPEVAELLADGGLCGMEPLAAPLKGFEDEPVTLWRLGRALLAEPT